MVKSIFGKSNYSVALFFQFQSNTKQHDIEDNLYEFLDFAYNCVSIGEFEAGF
jgi:hypothetical protein